MKKFVLIKNSVHYSADSILNNKFGKNFHPSVLTLPTIPYLIHIVNLFVVTYVEFFYKGRGIKKLIYDYSDNGNRSRWIIDYNEYRKLGKKVLADKNFLNIVIKDFKIAEKCYYREIRKLEKNGISDKNFLYKFLKLVELYITEYAVNYSVTGPIVFGYGDIIGAKLLNKYNNSEYIKNAIKILVKPKRNFLKQEKDNLDKVVNLARKPGVKIISLSKLRLEKPNIYKKLIEHQKKYYWIANNYKDVKYLKLNYFFKRFKKIFYNRNVKEKESSLLKNRINLKTIDREDITTLKMLGEMAQLHDQRKKANMIANYWLIEYLKKISKKTGVPYSILQLASLWEVIDLLNNKNVNLTKISKRINGCMIVNINGRKEYWLTGQNYKKFRNKIGHLINTEDNIKCVKGNIANHGKVKGRVKIVLNVNKEGGKVKKGDILVTSMTRPEFMPLIKRASGIITDEGGITSHAAIISRELNIPCIVGTKIATQVLKDGDLVEVDAERGIVKIIKRVK